MNLDDIGIFKLMSHKMGWLVQRQQVLAKNVANADTPGYQATDLATFKGIMDQGATLSLAVTASGHITPQQASGRRVRENREKRSYEVSPDGNKVVLEEQMMKVGQTQADYQMITNLYRKHLALIKTAIGRTGS